MELSSIHRLGITGVQNCMHDFLLMTRKCVSLGSHQCHTKFVLLETSCLSSWTEDPKKLFQISGGPLINILVVECGRKTFDGESADNVGRHIGHEDAADRQLDLLGWYAKPE